MTRLITLVLILSLTSCGLIQMPFKILGGVTKGTAQAIKKPINAHKERKAKKEKKKAKEEAKKKKEEGTKPQSDPIPEGLLLPENNGFPDLESIDPDLPPLPSEYQDLPPVPE